METVIAITLLTQVLVLGIEIGLLTAFYLIRK
jgi:hypothetical protein